MSISNVLIPFLIIPSLFINAQNRSISERLGYPADTKLLILHADGRMYAMEHDAVKNLLDGNTVVDDRILAMEPQTYKKGVHQFYSNLLKNLEPGLNFLLLLLPTTMPKCRP